MKKQIKTLAITKKEKTQIKKLKKLDAIAKNEIRKFLDAKYKVADIPFEYLNRVQYQRIKDILEVK